MCKMPLIGGILQFWGLQLLDPGSLWTLISAEAVRLCNSEMKFSWRLLDPAATVSLACKILPLKAVMALDGLP